MEMRDKKVALFEQKFAHYFLIQMKGFCRTLCFRVITACNWIDFDSLPIPSNRRFHFILIDPKVQ